MSGIGSTLALIVICGALIAMLFGVSALTHLRSASRGAGLALIGFVLTALAVMTEIPGELPLRPLLIFSGAVVAGMILASRVPLAARLTQVAWVAGLAAGGIAATSSSVALTTAGVAQVGASVSAVLGLSAMAIAVVRLKDQRDTPKSSVAVALSLTLGGLAELIAGVLAAQAVLLVCGGVVALAGVSLARAMANAAGRSLGQLLFGSAHQASSMGYHHVRQSDPQGAAMILAASQNVIIIPGYGLARAQGQHGVKELIERLETSGATVRVVVHPVAGVVPGHMNAILDEAGIAHSKLVESAQASQALVGADVIVIGANDIVNSDAAKEPGALSGLDALDLSAAHSVWVIKRSLGTGQAAVRNNLFELPQATMILGDAKKVLQALVAELKNAAH